MRSIVFIWLAAVLMSLNFGCATHPTVVTAETEPPRWQPHILIERSLVRDANKVTMVVNEASYTLRPTDAGWVLILTPEVLKQLLGDQDQKVHNVNLKYEGRNSKGRVEYSERTIQVVIYRPLNDTIRK